MRKQDLFEDCFTRQAFKDRLKELQDRASETKTIAQTLRKCVAELESLVKASQVQGWDSSLAISDAATATAE